MRRHLHILAWALALWAAPCLAQNSTRILVESAADSALAESASRNATALLTAVNYAYRHHQSPIMPDWAITEAGQETLEIIWVTSRFYCPYTELIRPLKNEGGIRLDGIRVFLASDEDGERASRYLILHLDEAGRISSIALSEN